MAIVLFVIRYAHNFNCHLINHHKVYYLMVTSSYWRDVLRQWGSCESSVLVVVRALSLSLKPPSCLPYYTSVMGGSDGKTCLGLCWYGVDRREHY